MKLVKKLKELGDLQENIVNQYNKLITETENSLDINENEKLRAELKELKADMAKLEEKYNQITKENKDLRLSLQEQIIDEKIHILKVSKKKMDLYFGMDKGTYTNRLKVLEAKNKFRIQQLKRKANNNIKEKNQAINAELNKVELLVNREISEERARQEEEELKLQKEMLADYSSMSDNTVPEETIKKKIKQNRVEMKIGLFWLNKIGVCLVLIGLAIFGYYNRENISNYVKGIAFFGVGIIFLVLGEILYRKKKETFAIGLLGGGIAVLYSAVFFCYFVLKVNGVSIITMDMALILSLITTLTAIVLSLRYNSKTIISFGLIGGYLPFLSYSLAIGFTGTAYYYGMGYLLILNLAVLIISFWKGWRVSNYLSFLLNVPALCYMAFSCPNTSVGIAFSGLFFAIYLAITLGYPLRNKKSLKILDILLIGANTITSAIVIYLLFEKLELDYLRGVLALAFCLIYSGLGYFVNRVMKKERGTIVVLFLTALTFAVLMIPFQFGKHWFTMGWLVEGVLLVVYGYKKKIKPLEIAGWILTALCAGGFFFFDFFTGVVFDSYNVKVFDLKYFFIIAGISLVYMVYQWDIYKNKLAEFTSIAQFIKGFKFFVLFHQLIFLNYIALTYFDKIFYEWNNFDLYKIYSVMNFFKILVVAMIFLGYGFMLTKLKPVRDKATAVISVILYIIGDLICIGGVLFNPILQNNILQFSNNKVIEYITFAILILLNILIVLNLKDLILRLLRKQRGSLEYYPLWLGLIITAIITSVVTRQLGLTTVSIVLGFSYLIIAVSCIVYGFSRKFLYVRFYGLALILVALIILFLKIFIDSTTLGKIITFIGFGLICLGISYIYQMVNKNIEKITGTEQREKVAETTNSPKGQTGQKEKTEDAKESQKIKKTKRKEDDK